MACKQSKEADIYKEKKYWYHVSSTLRAKKKRLVPWDEDRAINRDYREPAGKRICVAPTIEQCITAVPYALHQKFVIYRTEVPCLAKQPKDIFDSSVTHEGWLTKPTTFVRVGKLDFEKIEETRRGRHVIPEAGSKNSISYSAKVLRWWRKIVIAKHLEST